MNIIRAEFLYNQNVKSFGKYFLFIYVSILLRLQQVHLSYRYRYLDGKSP